MSSNSTTPELENGTGDAQSRVVGHHPVLWIGLRRAALVEVALYLGIAVVLDSLFFSGERFFTTTPHPFWPIVLLAAAQYGTSEGLVAAAAASLALLFGNIPPQSINQDIYDYILTISRLPLMWFVSAVVLGELRQRHIGERDELKTELGATVERESKLAGAYERLSIVKESLETRVVGQVRTAVTMYEAARTLEKQDPGEVLLGSVDIVRAVLNPERFSLYLLKGDALEVSIGEGWTAKHSGSRFFKSDSLIFQEIVGRQRILCMANPDDERILGPEGVLAGPLVDTREGQVIGMLKIESLGFLDLHFTNVQTFKVLCQWIADAYVNAMRYQDAQEDSVYSRETELFSHSFFVRQAEYLGTIAQRVGFDVSMILLRLENAADLTDEERRLIPGVFKKCTSSLLREVDLTFDYQIPGLQFCILLPKCSRDHAQLVADKFKAGFEADLRGQNVEARFGVTLKVIHKHDASVEMLRESNEPE